MISPATVTARQPAGSRGAILSAAGSSGSQTTLSRSLVSSPCGSRLTDSVRAPPPSCAAASRSAVAAELCFLSRELRRTTSAPRRLFPARGAGSSTTKATAAWSSATETARLKRASISTPSARSCAPRARAARASASSVAASRVASTAPRRAWIAAPSLSVRETRSLAWDRAAAAALEALRAASTWATAACSAAAAVSRSWTA